MKALKVLKYVGFGLLGLMFVTLMVYLTMSLWNWLVPQLFHGPVVTFWQAGGLLLLSKILFSGMSRGGHKHHDKSQRRFFDGERGGREAWWKHYREKCKERHGSANEGTDAAS